MSTNPAASSVVVTAPDAPRAKNIGQTSDATRAPTIGNSSAHPQLRRSPQTDTTTRPPDFNTRKSSRVAASGSGTYINPSEHSATSNVRSTRRSSASQQSSSTFARLLSANLAPRSAIIFWDRSVARTQPPGSTLAARSGSRALIGHAP